MAEPLASSLSELATVAKAVIQSGYFPDAKSESQALVKMMWGHELGVGPMASVQGIWVIETRKGPALRLSGELMGALIKRAPGWDYTFTLTDDRCEVTVIHDGKALEPVSFTLGEARKAGLVRNGMPWDQYTKDMLWNRAMSRTKRHCANLFYGLSAPVLDADEADAEPMGHDQRKAIFAGLKPYDMSDDERHAWASDILGRRVDSFAEGQPTCPTRREATILLNWLDSREDEPKTATAGEADGAEPREEEGDGADHRLDDWVPASEATDAAGAGTTGPEVPMQPTPAAPHTVQALIGESDAMAEYRDVREQIKARKRNAAAIASTREFMIGQGEAYKGITPEDGIKKLDEEGILEQLTAKLIERHLS